MNKKIKYLIVFLLVVLLVLVVNEFVLFTSKDKTQSSFASCAFPSLEAVNYFDYVVLGTAKGSKWVNYTKEVFLSNSNELIYPIEVLNDTVQGKVIERKFIKTHTAFNVRSVLKGDLSSNNITLSIDGGCDVRRNFCQTSSHSVYLEEGQDYLLFLQRIPSENILSPEIYFNTFGGFNFCFGVYPVTLDSQGKLSEDTILFFDVTYKDLIDFLEE
jgi:hypothetical protein